MDSAVSYAEKAVPTRPQGKSVGSTVGTELSCALRRSIVRLPTHSPTVCSAFIHTRVVRACMRSAWRVKNIRKKKGCGQWVMTMHTDANPRGILRLSCYPGDYGRGF